MLQGAARALLLLLALDAPVAAEDASPWLERMNHSLALLDYQGTFVHVRDGEVDALRVVHEAVPSGARERLTSLSGESREINREGAEARLSGGVAEPFAAGSRMTPGAPDADAFRRSYQAVLGGSDRIADRPTRIVEIRPRDGFRYGYRLWLEETSALPLKSVTFGSDGRAVEQWMFTDITIGQSSGDAAQQQPDAAHATVVAPAQEPAWEVRDAPRGFVLTRSSVFDGGGEHQVYSDGLAVVSVYIEPLGGSESNLSGLLRRGALSLFGRVLEGPQQVTVVGLVPPQTVERFAQGVVPADAR